MGGFHQRQRAQPESYGAIDGARLEARVEAHGALARTVRADDAYTLTVGEALIRVQADTGDFAAVLPLPGTTGDVAPRAA